MKPSRHFTANIASRCFASVTLKCKPNTHETGHNSASATAICSHSRLLANDDVYASFVNRKNNMQTHLAARLL